jgi:hypothetical protein
MAPETYISPHNITLLTLLIILSLICYLLIPNLRKLTQTAYTQGYKDGQYELKTELSNTREEMKIFRQEMQSMKEMVEDKLKTTERYRADMGIKQSAFLMAIEDWFDLRRAEMKELREEQLQALEGLKEGRVGEEERIVEEERFVEERLVGDGKLDVEVEGVGKSVVEKTEGRRGSGWARLRVTKKKSKKDLSQGALKGD